jgi:hypothetical protein
MSLKRAVPWCLTTLFALIASTRPLHAAPTPITLRSSLFALPNATAAAVPTKIIHAGEDRIPGEYIVVLNDGVTGEQVLGTAADLATTYGAQIRQVWFEGVKSFYANMTDEQALALSQDARVQYLEENARWYLSSSQQTNINPVSCDPVAGTCATVVDDRLWHLDRTDQNLPDPTNSFRYCSDGTGVTVYVVDTGVNKNHQEFGGARVLAGVNTSGDNMPADDPCMGFALPPAQNAFANIEGSNYQQEVLVAGHGTSVASVLGGRRVGVAKNVTIVPVKTSRCDYYSARYRISANFYSQNETMFLASGSAITAIYRATNGGYTAGTDPGNWPVADNATKVDGQVTWQVVPASAWQNIQDTAKVYAGLLWILSSQNTSPKEYAIVTMSTFRPLTESGVVGPGATVEQAIRNLLASKITVVASANNQNGSACDTTPARLSINNPDVSVRNDVITVGGSMVLNRPWAVDITDVTDPDAAEADGPTTTLGQFYGVEPAYDATKPVRDARWICGAGDSNKCSNSTSISTVNPVSPAYPGYDGGSNGGPCVTLFAPAKNLFLATPAAVNGYRDARLRDAFGSGTSWAAPIVAGYAARILQNNPAYTPTDVRSALLANSVATLDAGTLDPRDYNGNLIANTPNKLLKLSDVNITSQPASAPAAVSGTTPLTAAASGTSTVSYQWYEVNSSFDYLNNHNGAHASTLITGATTATYNAPASTTRRAYWARATNSCGSADTDIAVVVTRPTATPTGLTALATGTSVTVGWSAVAGAERYVVERKVTGQPWLQAAELLSSTLSYTETPATPDGIVVYRVRSATGVGYLPSGNLATSGPSNYDFANVTSYEAFTGPPVYTPVKAQHLIELRQAVNAICDAIGAPHEYQASDLALAALQGHAILASDFTSLLTHINNVRTNSLIGLTAASFQTTPVAASLISRTPLQDLRNALK